MGATDPPEVREVGDGPRDVDGRLDIDAMWRSLGPADLLESAPGTGWTYVVPHGGEELLDDGSETILRRHDGSVEALGSDPFDALEEVCDRRGIDPAARRDSTLPPFTGGLIGAFGYDLARRVELLPDPPVRDRTAGDMHLRVADVVLAVAPDRDRALLLHTATAARRADRIQHRIVSAATGTGAAAEPARRRPLPAPTVDTSLGEEEHLAAVATILAAIAAGEVFQVNLTQRLSARWEGDLGSLYRRLRHHSAAAYGAVLPSIGVASISPETFLEVDGRQVVTRPIKGTRPRAREPALDAALADDLATAPKDRAENIMVVDLERNDLGRVCEPGSIHVPRLLEVEGHPTVWHLVSTVAGTLRPGIGYGALLRAVFPCGSITGAPKVAAMRLIDRIEPVRRGWYCGAIGFLAPGAAALSVAIRTASLHPDGIVDYGAGGGIVADSDPRAEREESLDKAAAFLRAIGADPTGSRPT